MRDPLTCETPKNSTRARLRLNVHGMSPIRLTDVGASEHARHTNIVGSTRAPSSTRETWSGRLNTSQTGHKHAGSANTINMLNTLDMRSMHDVLSTRVLYVDGAPSKTHDRHFRMSQKDEKLGRTFSDLARYDLHGAGLAVSSRWTCT